MPELAPPQTAHPRIAAQLVAGGWAILNDTESKPAASGCISQLLFTEQTHIVAEMKRRLSSVLELEAVMPATSSAPPASASPSWKKAFTGALKWK